jgi:hypothetical protein
VVTYLYFDSQRVERNNNLLKEMCLRAQKACHAGNEAACVESLRCIKALENLGKGGGNVTEELGKLAVTVAAGYAFIVYGMPWILGKLGTDTEKKAERQA